MGQTWNLFLFLFSPFSQHNFRYNIKFEHLNRRRVDAVLGSQNRDRRMVGADEATVQCRRDFKTNTFTAFRQM